LLVRVTSWDQYLCAFDRSEARLRRLCCL